MHDAQGRTALHLAVMKASRTSWDMPPQRKQLSESATRILLQAMGDDMVGRQDFSGRTALHYAVEAELPGAVDLLLRRFDQTTAELQDLEGATALHLAAQRGPIEVVDRLLSSWISLHQA